MHCCAKVKTQAGTTVAVYTYYGTKWRESFKTDTDSDGDADGSDKTYHMVYDENWRLLARIRESDSYFKEEFTNSQAGLAGDGDSSYINSVICRDADYNAAWEDASTTGLETRQYLCENWRGDVSAVVSSGGAMVEWAKYAAYGMPFGLPAGDTNSNGMADVNDYNQINTWISGSTYNVLGDLDLSGAVNVNDLVALNNTGWPTLGRGVLTRVGFGDNRKGYAGYEYEPALAGGMYLARHRDLVAERGEWLTRDPLEYHDGLDLYGYAHGNPVQRSDPSGLAYQQSGPACGGDDLTYDVTKDACKEASRLSKLNRKWCQEAQRTSDECTTECESIFRTEIEICRAQRLPRQKPQQFCKACAAVRPELFPDCAAHWAAESCCSQVQTQELLAQAACAAKTVRKGRGWWKRIRRWVNFDCRLQFEFDYHGIAYGECTGPA